MESIFQIDHKEQRATSLRAFTLAFFESFGASIQQLDQGQQGALHVDLPDPLADHFGKTALHLVFQNAEATSDTDLVAYGSRVFDQMMDYLDRRGALTVQQLPARHNGANELLRAVQPRNAAVAGLQLSEETRLLFVFNWHITYRADDKREELFTVVVDENHTRVPVIEDADAFRTGNSGAVHLETLLADAEPVPPEINADGQPVLPKLPPMTHLTRLAESARKYALYHADVRCVGHEAEILPRLHKVLSRLTSYYEQQIEEVYDAHDPSGEKRRALEEDLQRKIAEEVENHRLRVQVKLFSYAILHVPVAAAQIRLHDGRQEVAIQVVRNRYTGTLRRPACHACGEPIRSLMLCRNGHVICEECSVQCQHCQEVLCPVLSEGCGLHTCPDCGKQNCETCSVLCWACGERACVAHSSRCPTCGDEICHACQEACADCDTRQCRSHLRVDGVTGRLLCRSCAVRCPGCQSYSSRLETCGASGQRFCANCIEHCVSCGRSVGPGFYTLEPTNGQIYCANCLQTCPTCGKQTAVIVEHGCAVCGRSLCGHCSTHCATCDTLLCPDHGTTCFDCGDPICTEHQERCLVGQEIICVRCGAGCAICGHVHCQQHAATCELCAQIYCVNCVRRSGLCDTCSELVQQGQPVAMVNEPIFADPRVQNFWDKYRWRCRDNQRYRIYLDGDTWGRNVLIVAEGATVRRLRRGRFGILRDGIDTNAEDAE